MKPIYINLSTLVLATLLLAAHQSAHAQDPTQDIVELKTNIGTITIKLDYQNAPLTSRNFVSYSNKGFYKDTLFHRVIKEFVVQGGGYNKLDGKLKATLAPIINESNNGLSNVTGTISMARTSAPNSATSQFYINLNDNTDLDYVDANSPGYAVFGKVIDGMGIVRQIENLATYNELPFTNSAGLVFIENVYASYGSSNDDTRITINGSGKVISDPQPGTGTIKLTAKSAPGYLFSSWSGDCRGSNQIITIDTSKGQHNCTANFTKSLSAVQ